MNTRLKYQICSLHEEPLNYICLHARCIDHRVICAICKEQRHPSSHLTMPLKIYLSQKAQQLKCLTKSKIDLIEQTLINEKKTLSELVNKIREETIEKLRILQQNCNNFLNEKINKLRECSEMINYSQFDIADMSSVQQVLKIVGNYQDQKQQIEQKLISLKERIQFVLNSVRIEENRQIYKWEGHKQLCVTQNIINSNSDGYKVAYIGKQITRSFNKIAFRIISAEKNWIALGVCYETIVKRRNFDFRYFTIGHGIYAVSSHGGIWSHDQSQYNNTMGNFKFSERQTIIVTYDFNDHKVIFENQEGLKFCLKVNKKLSDNLRFCLVLYHSNDQVEFINQLSIPH